LATASSGCSCRWSAPSRLGPEGGLSRRVFRFVESFSEFFELAFRHLGARLGKNVGFFFVDVLLDRGLELRDQCRKLFGVALANAVDQAACVVVFFFCVSDFGFLARLARK
jgi:hypothetical protein